MMSLEPLITVDHTKCYCPSSTEEEYSLKVTTTRYLRRKYQRRFAPYKTAQKFISFPPEMWDPASSHGYPTFNATNDSVFRPSPTMIHQHCSDNIPPYVTAQVSDRMMQPSVPQPGCSDMLNTFSSSPKRLEKSLVTEVGESGRGKFITIPQLKVSNPESLALSFRSMKINTVPQLVTVDTRPQEPQNS